MVSEVKLSDPRARSIGGTARVEREWRHQGLVQVRGQAMSCHHDCKEAAVACGMISEQGQEQGWRLGILVLFCGNGPFLAELADCSKPQGQMSSGQQREGSAAL